VDVLLTAAARILAEGGLAAANTNRIAEVAGVSVGSLYQYFPSKEALVAALIERRVDSELAGFTTALARRRELSLLELARWLARAFVEMHAAERDFYDAVLPIVEHVERERFVRERVERAGAALGAAFAERRRELVPPDPELAAFVALRAAEAVVHAAVHERPSALASGAIATELEALLTRYLCLRPPA
jgi:AcrR family transcriptional regulator